MSQQEEAPKKQRTEVFVFQASMDRGIPIIPDRIRTVRFKRKRSLTYIGTHIGMDQSNYSKVEHGHRPLPRNRLFALVLALETSIDYLCGLTDDDRPYPRSEAFRDPNSSLL